MSGGNGKVKRMIKVLIVDDSAVMRKILTEELSKYQDIEIVGTAVDPYIARNKIVRVRPDVITLDLEMPRMDGLSFLAKLMKYYPVPVVILSSFTPANSENALRALELGAVEAICKPGSAYATADISRRLVHAIRAAASSRIVSLKQSATAPAVGQLKNLHVQTADKVIAIGASTGGTKAIETVLMSFPENMPGILIVQHMPENFTHAYAERLNKMCSLEVREAKDYDQVRPGVVLIAPGDRHMMLSQSGEKKVVKIKGGPPVHYQRPSVDVLFQSVARCVGKNAIGVLLTGMGADGAKGMLALYERGANTIAQDEESCVVFGMPREAIRLGAVEDVVPLQEISRTIIEALDNSQRKPRGKRL